MFNTIDWPHEVVNSHLKIFNNNLEKIIENGNYKEKQSGFRLMLMVNTQLLYQSQKQPLFLPLSGIKRRRLPFLEVP